MTRLLAALAAVWLAVPTFGQPKEPPKATPADTAAALAGTYTVKEATFDGKPAPEELVKNDATEVVIKDGTITVRLPKKDDTTKFVAEPQKDAKTPANIDFTSSDGKAKQGLYKLDKSDPPVLTIAFSDAGERPVDVSGGEGVRRLVLVRKPEPKKDPPKSDK